MKSKHILLVDDSPGDTELALDALRQYHPDRAVVTLRDGAEALDYLYRRGPFATVSDAPPLVILLDLKMPRVDGLAVLREIKASPMLRVIPVVMMTSSREETDVLQSYQLGVNGYVVKPVSFTEFLDSMKAVGTFWGKLNEPVPVGYKF